jgi:hypothetical protein
MRIYKELSGTDRLNKAEAKAAHMWLVIVSVVASGLFFLQNI